MRLQGRFKSMVGFAAKAGKIAFGTAKASAVIKSGRSGLLLIDVSASLRTMKDARNMCEYYGAELIEIEPAGELGRLTGKDILLAAITDRAFSDELIHIYKESSYSMEV